MQRGGSDGQDCSSRIALRLFTMLKPVQLFLKSAKKTVLTRYGAIRYFPHFSPENLPDPGKSANLLYFKQ